MGGANRCCQADAGDGGCWTGVCPSGRTFVWMKMPPSPILQADARLSIDLCTPVWPSDLVVQAIKLVGDVVSSPNGFELARKHGILFGCPIEDSPNGGPLGRSGR